VLIEKPMTIQNLKFQNLILLEVISGGKSSHLTGFENLSGVFTKNNTTFAP
jgi:hypothetical protein